MPPLDAAFKKYDIRGRVPEDIDEAGASAVGNAFAVLLEREGGPGVRIVVGHDMRASSAALADSLASGAQAAGADVLFAGLVSTDEIYFASGSKGIGGAVITASHNPARDNGIKLCRPGAGGLSADSGLGIIRELTGGPPARSVYPGQRIRIDLLADYVALLHSLSPVQGRRLRVCVDAGNGMAGLSAPAVLGGLDVEVDGMFLELDGTFPNHQPNPLDPANLVDLQRRVREVGADIGLAFDGDADRCFVVDETGSPVSPSAVTAMIAVRELDQHPGGVVIHNLITSRAVPEIVERHGGRAVRTPVGHSTIKATMRATGAVFGGEHSGHYYFRDFFHADSGMLAALHVLAQLAADDRPLSALAAGYDPYSQSGELNLEVADPTALVDAVERVWTGRPDSPDVTVDRLDGLTVSGAGWWFNVRPSNTEPLLRLNVEARDETTMVAVRDRVRAELLSLAQGAKDDLAR